ncbi:hypothetical protein RRG08_003703 [Elysia crispata]|uniref:Uncharacterized protein n=1 Tax=Elysia crispata TaxID=231223 RepID=A0AAE1AVB0_9GAST|nr:hypothetical protein RRG08_003703 [Elysia crispata]
MHLQSPEFLFPESTNLHALYGHRPLSKLHTELMTDFSSTRDYQDKRPLLFTGRQRIKPGEEDGENRRAFPLVPAKTQILNFPKAACSPLDYEATEIITYTQ